MSSSIFFHSAAAVGAVVVGAVAVVVTTVVLGGGVVVVAAPTTQGGTESSQEMPESRILPRQQLAPPPGLDWQPVPPQTPHEAAQQMLPARIPVAQVGSCAAASASASVSRSAEKRVCEDMAAMGEGWRGDARKQQLSYKDVQCSLGVKRYIWEIQERGRCEFGTEDCSYVAHAIWVLMVPSSQDETCWLVSWLAASVKPEEA